MMTLFQKRTSKTLLYLLLLTSSVFATHNVSRYFPLLERPEEYTIKNRSHFTPAFLYLNDSTAFTKGGHSGGVPELWGSYDLKDVVKSLQTVNTGANPWQTVTGSADNFLSDKSLKYRVFGKVRGQGVSLSYEHDLKCVGLQVGIWVPFVSINTTTRFDFDRAASVKLDQRIDSPSVLGIPSYPFFAVENPTDRKRMEQEQLIDKVRRETHQEIGFKGNEWTETGVGDIDVHVRWNHIYDHVLLMRSIDFNIQAGLIIPSGFVSDPDVPSSLSFGSNGHWGLYWDWLTACELKQDWTLGLWFGFAYLFDHTRNLRVSVGGEPTIFSALRGRVRIEPGATFKFSPYFILGNLTDGLDLQVRYTYLRHNTDKWEDVRSDKSIACYLNNRGLTEQKEALSKWSCHYITMQLSYDTKTAMNNVTLDPVLFVGYDIPINGNGVAKTHQVNVGAELHF
jgi:hypothetical protein